MVLRGGKAAAATGLAVWPLFLSVVGTSVQRKKDVVTDVQGRNRAGGQSRSPWHLHPSRGQLGQEGRCPDGLLSPHQLPVRTHGGGRGSWGRPGSHRRPEPH